MGSAVTLVEDIGFHETTSDVLETMLGVQLAKLTILLVLLVFLLFLFNI